MSHDIRTPMNAIIGMTEMANYYIDDKEKVQDCLKKISDSSSMLLHLINNVLDMSEIENHELKLKETSFELLELIIHSIEIVLVLPGPFPSAACQLDNVNGKFCQAHNSST